jgi:hypothetical protein
MSNFTLFDVTIRDLRKRRHKQATRYKVPGRTKAEARAVALKHFVAFPLRIGKVRKARNAA